MQDSEPSWLVMVDRGATTMWELWNGLDADGTPHQSLNHYSKGAVVSFLHRYTAGLRQAPGSAGYERIIIEPRPGAGLTSAATSHRGPHGLIEVQWTMDDGGLQLSATVPPGTTAEVRLPGEPAAVVGPGTHHFTAARQRRHRHTKPPARKEHTMTVNEATEVHATERTDIQPGPGGVDVPPFPVFDAPGVPETRLGRLRRAPRSHLRPRHRFPAAEDGHLASPAGNRTCSAGGVGPRRRLPAG